MGREGDGIAERKFGNSQPTSVVTFFILLSFSLLLSLLLKHYELRNIGRLLLNILSLSIPNTLTSM